MDVTSPIGSNRSETGPALGEPRRRRGRPPGTKNRPPVPDFIAEADGRGRVGYNTGTPAGPAVPSPTKTAECSYYVAPDTTDPFGDLRGKYYVPPGSLPGAQQGFIRENADLKEQPGVDAGYKGRQVNRHLTRGEKDGRYVEQTLAHEILERQRILKGRAASLGIPRTDFTHTLSFITRKMEGGRERFIQFVALAASMGDADCQRFLHAFEEVPKWQREHRIGLDLLALSVGIQPVNLLKAVVGIAFESQVDAARMIALASQPDVMSATIESAKRIDSQIGLRDRHALLQASGVLPTPKGGTINIGVQANASSAATAAASAAASVPNIPSFVSDMNVVSKARETVQRRLLAEAPAPEPITFSQQEREHAPIDVRPETVE